MGYLPVQTVLEGDALESPAPSPQHSHTIGAHDMHSRLEMYASRLAEVELRTRFVVQIGIYVVLYYLKS